MKQFLSFLSCIFFFVMLNAQSNYAEAIRQGDAAFNSGQYKTAINKYFAAEAFDPTKKDVVKEKVNRAFDAIEALRKKAEDVLAELKKQKSIAEEERQKALNRTAEAKKQQGIAEEERQKALNNAAEAKKQQNIAEEERQKALNNAAEAKKQQGIAEEERQKALNNAIEARKQQDIAQKALGRILGFQEKSVGKKYRGGIIFYTDSMREHGLIAAEKDLDFSYTWVDAKKACDNYSVTVDSVTYDDWFLPSKHELALLYINKSAVGGFGNKPAVGDFSSDYYWSSLKNDKFTAWYQRFSDGLQENGNKLSRLHVRAVRTF
jgi:hypothetical protein